VDALLGEAQRLAYRLGRQTGVFGFLDRFGPVAPQAFAVAVQLTLAFAVVLRDTA
jgi:hypothetical protein